MFVRRPMRQWYLQSKLGLPQRPSWLSLRSRRRLQSAKHLRSRPRGVRLRGRLVVVSLVDVCPEPIGSRGNLGFPACYPTAPHQVPSTLMSRPAAGTRPCLAASDPLSSTCGKLNRHRPPLFSQLFVPPVHGGFPRAVRSVCVEAPWTVGRKHAGRRVDQWQRPAVRPSCPSEARRFASVGFPPHGLALRRSSGLPPRAGCGYGSAEPCSAMVDAGP